MRMKAKDGETETESASRNQICKVLVINTPGLANKGSEAVVIGAISCIEKSVPRVDVTFLSHHYEADKKAFSRIAEVSSLRFRVKKHPWYREFSSKPLTAIYSGIRCSFSLPYCALCRIARKFGLEPRNVFHECDLIIDLNVDSLNEYYQGAFAPIFVLLTMLHGAVAGKPIVVCAASIAPFKRRILRFLLRTVLDRTQLITVREKFSLEHLQALSVVKPRVHLTADLAFLLEPCSTERVDVIMRREDILGCERPLIGIAVAPKSRFARPESYLRLMAESSDGLVRQLNATLVYIPNSFQAGVRSDSSTIQEIYQKVETKRKVRVVRGEYTAEELKGIISRCDLFVSARFHPLVASTSMAIPSVGLVGYHRHKWNGVIGEMMEQQEYLINMDEFDDYDALQALLISKVCHAWRNRDSVREKLTERAELAKELALHNGGLIRNLIDGLQ